MSVNGWHYVRTWSPEELVMLPKTPSGGCWAFHQRCYQIPTLNHLIICPFVNCRSFSMILCVIKDALSGSSAIGSLVSRSIQNFTTRPGLLKDFLEVIFDLFYHGSFYWACLLKYFGSSSLSFPWIL